MSELKGTTECPICGYDQPHHHSQEEIEAAQPTVAGVIAHCRLSAKRLRTGDATDNGKKWAAEIYSQIAERLEKILP